MTRVTTILKILTSISSALEPSASAFTLEFYVKGGVQKIKMEI